MVMWPKNVDPDMPRKHGPNGQYVDTVTHEAVLDVFEKVDGPGVVLSADVADALGVTRETARRKLKELHDTGVLDRRETGRRLLYWRVDPDRSGKIETETETETASDRIRS